MAERIQREHQRPTPPIPTKGHRPHDRARKRPPQHPTQPQRTTTQDPRLPDTIREVRRVRCSDRLNPPILLDASNLPKVKHTERKPYGTLKKGTVETIHLPWFQSATYRVVELNRRTRKYAVKILQASCSARGTVQDRKRVGK